MKWIFVLTIAFVLILAGTARAADDCILVARLPPDEETESVEYTDPQGRELCRLKLFLHDRTVVGFAPPGDEHGGYAAAFNEAHVQAHRTDPNVAGLSHAQVFAKSIPPDVTPTEPTGITPTPTEMQPTPTDTPTNIPPEPTPTGTPFVESPTPTETQITIVPPPSTSTPTSTGTLTPPDTPTQTPTGTLTPTDTATPEPSATPTEPVIPPPPGSVTPPPPGSITPHPPGSVTPHPPGSVTPPPGSVTPPPTTSTQVPPVLPDTGSGPFDSSQGGRVGLFALVLLGILGILFIRGYKRSRG